MEYRELGNTGLMVSRLCFGGLVIGPLQKKITVEEGGEVIARRFDWESILLTLRSLRDISTYQKSNGHFRHQTYYSF